MSIPLPVVVFEAECGETMMGQSVHVLGSIGELGEWQPERSTAFVTSVREFPLWRSRLFQLKSTPPNTVIEFKLLIKTDAEPNTPPIWEQCANRKFRCPQQGQLARVTAVFGKNNQVSVTITEAAVASALEGFSEEASRPQILVTSPPRQDASPLFGSGEKGLQRGSMKFSCSRPLRDLISMQSRHLPAAALRIMDDHTKSRSLRQKFLLVKDILTQRSTTSDLSVEEWVQLLLSIAFCALYISWVATGVIPCGEDGGHHRPNQAAVAGQEILNFYEDIRYRSARLYAGTHRWELDMFKYFSSLITPCLPSCASQFTCSVPLTRIRDIAHRNDIGEDLKREIKGRLQNKLHRCAGPEDLQTCKEFIQRFQANPNAYPNDFLHQFNLFYQELRDFFNAADLTERLQSMQNNASNPRRANAVSWFLSNKFAFDNKQSSDWAPLCENLLSMMRCTTHLRMAVVDELEMDAFQECSTVFFGSDPSHGQSLHILDVQAEKLLFTLTSRLVNEAEKVSSGGFKNLSSETKSLLLTDLLSCLMEILKNVACSNFARHYSLILSQEIKEKVKTPLDGGEDLTLIHCASLARRVLRLCETFSDFISVALPPERTAEFATALGVPSEMGRVFGEGLIRASLPFQASRCASLLLRLVEVEGLGRSPFVTISSSQEGVGVAITTDTIDHFDSSTHFWKLTDDESAVDELAIIMMVKTATGDEELEGLASRLTAKLRRPVRLAGILLSHEIPTMSHLGVRARQQGIAFVALSNPLKDWEELTREFDGKAISLVTGEPKVHLHSAGAFPPKKEATSSERSSVQSAETVCESVADTANSFLRCGSQITEADCGSKAAQCQRLHELASDLKIAAPKSAAFDNRAFTHALQWPENDHIREEINASITQLQAPMAKDDEEEVCHRLNSLIVSMERNRETFSSIESTVWSYLAGDAASVGEIAVMVRSSSNVEDLEGLSAAGLYESYPATLSWELDKINFDSVWAAVKGVWASLYTSRAVKARRCAGVDSGAWMAVLIQPLLPATWSFVAHTQCPAGMGGAENDLYAELAQGLGEALAGGGVELGGGRPTRLFVNKETGQVCVQTLTDFWAKYGVDDETGACVKLNTALRPEEVSHGFWDAIGQKLLTLVKIERYYDSRPQDIEGCFMKEHGEDESVICGEMGIVQTRPQPTAV